MASLVVFRDHVPLLRVKLDKNDTRIGRGRDVDVYIEDAKISRVHAIIRKESEGYRFIDKSTNGTLLNGNIARVARLKDQDKLQFGETLVVFEADANITEEPANTLVSTIVSNLEPMDITYNATNSKVISSNYILYIDRANGSRNSYPILSKRLMLGSGKSDDVLLEDFSNGAFSLYFKNDNCYLELIDKNINLGLFSKEKSIILQENNKVLIGQNTIFIAREFKEEPVSTLEVSIFEGMIGTTPAMGRLFAMIDRFSKHSAPVMILGETGTGKELVSKALHSRGARASYPFIAINCSAIASQLFESELFGHEKGAFTGAVKSQKGAIESANNGTLFLDELGDMPLELQAKLLRVLETSMVTPVGSHQARKVDVRFVAATHKNIRQMVEDGRFRADLFYRLFVLTLELPPLRERIDDLEALVSYFLRDMSISSVIPQISRSALKALKQHSWPGNIRELRHVLTRSLAASENNIINEISFINMGAVVKQELKQEEASSTLVNLENMEKDAIERALKSTNNNRTDAAKMLGIARSTLHLRIKKYGLDV